MAALIHIFAMNSQRETAEVQIGCCQSTKLITERVIAVFAHAESGALPAGVLLS